jgi:hypothetical protein
MRRTFTEARKPGAPQAYAARCAHRAHEAAGLEQALGHVVLEPARVHQRLVPGGREVAEHDRAQRQHQAAQQASAHEHRAAAGRALGVEPHRQDVRGLAQRHQLARQRTVGRAVQHRLDLSHPLGPRARAQGRYGCVGQRIAALEERREAVEAGAVARAQPWVVDEARRWHTRSIAERACLGAACTPGGATAWTRGTVGRSLRASSRPPSHVLVAWMDGCGPGSTEAAQASRSNHSLARAGGRSRSTTAAVDSNRCSAHGRAMSCRPTGSPASSAPTGTLRAG